MSNLDAIEKKLKEQGKRDSGFSTSVTTPDTPKAKVKRQEDCPKCRTRSIVKGFCIICGYETKD